MGDEVTAARMAIGLPVNRFAFMTDGKDYPLGAPIVCKCIHCGTLFGSQSADLADLDHVCKGDCGRHWQHDQK